MPRRGKAATRQARQRRAQARPPATAVAAAPDVVDEPELVRAPIPRSERSEGYGGSSALSARARTEYHYVVSDLRNIGVLVAGMLAILIVALFAFRAIGIGSA